MCSKRRANTTTTTSRQRSRLLGGALGGAVVGMVSGAWAQVPASAPESRPAPRVALPPLDLPPLAPATKAPTATPATATPATATPDAATAKGTPANQRPPEPAPSAPPPIESQVEPPDAALPELPAATVVRERRQAATPAAVFDIELGALNAVPRRDASEQLMLAPGVFTANHGGEGHANETFMRGFAAGEGQDIEFLLHQVPLNEVSNAHGHGYADVLFILPELVERVRVAEGPFDPDQGDFAFAGSAEYRLGVPQRGTRLSASQGSFDTQRLLALWAPEGEADDTFGAVEFFRTDGFGTNRAAERANATLRYAHKGTGGSPDFALTLIGHATRFDQPGILRQDDFRAGRVGFFDTYDPAQGGEASRLLVFAETGSGPVDRRFEQTTFLQLRDLRMRSNYTGFQEDDLRDDDGAFFVSTVQRGDLTEMRTGTLTAGSRGRYTLQTPAWGGEQVLAVGYAARYDRGASSQRRLRAVNAIPYRRIFDNQFDILNLAGWLRTDLQPTPWLTLRAGARIDAFSFGVTDLANPPADREGPRLRDQRVQAFGFALNPRAVADIGLDALGLRGSGLHLVASYGRGTRSTEAAALSDNEAAPFAQSHSADVGLTWRHNQPGKDAWAATAQVSYDYTRVAQDLVFDETAGRNIAAGASTRHVLLGTGRLYLGRHFDGLLNLSAAEATLDATGARIPYIPRFIGRTDLGLRGALFGWRLGGVPVTGRAGLGFTYLPGRPLPQQAQGDPIALLNLGGQVRLWHTALDLSVRNLLDRRYRQSEFNLASNFEGPDAPHSRVAARHFVAGEPLTAMVTLTVFLEDLFFNAPSEDEHDAHTDAAPTPHRGATGLGAAGPDAAGLGTPGLVHDAAGAGWL